MSKRERLILTLVFIALGVSMALFAWTSLARFLVNKGNEDLPLVDVVRVDAHSPRDVLALVDVPQSDGSLSSSATTDQPHQDYLVCASDNKKLNSRPPTEAELEMTKERRYGLHDQQSCSQSNRELDTASAQDKALMNAIEKDLKQFLNTLF